MAVYWQEYRKHCVEKLAEQRALLSALENGEIQFRQKTLDNPMWVDTTAQTTEQTRRTVAEYEGLIARIDKDHPGEPLAP